MAADDYFPFMRLPQLVQEMIADEIIRKLDFTDRKHFCSTSKYCNWLIQQSKMKKRISIKSSRFEDKKFILESFDKHVLSFSSEEEMVKFLKMVKFIKIDRETILKIFSIPKFGFVSPMKDLWLDAMEFLEEFNIVLKPEYFDLCMEIASKLNYLRYCYIDNYLSSEKLLKIVDTFPKLPNLTLYGKMDDEILKLLATKSNKSNPLNKLTLVPWVGFSIDAVEHFFKRATFVDDSLIDLETNATLSEVEKIIKRIDKYEVSLSQEQESIVAMTLTKIDEEIYIEAIISLNS